MNEEEKEAIEFMNNIEYKQVNSDEFYDNRDILINLINKQQKEIEELKNDHIDFWINTKEVEDMVRGKFINKDKIKELIKEKAKTDTYNFTTIAVKDIEELLRG